MRLRGLLIGVFGAAALVAAAAAAWPLLSPRAASLVADRLGRETGLAWRVGGLDLDLNGLVLPGLVLRDVTLDGGGLSGRLRRVHATAPLALMLGGSGTVEADVEGASLTVPLDGLSRAASGGRGDAGATGGLAVSAVRAVVRGADAALAGRTLALAAGTVRLALDLTEGGAGGDPAVRLDLPDLGALADIEGSAGSAARNLRVALAPATGPRIAATAELRRDATGLRLDRIAGTIDRAPFSGSLGAEVPGQGAKPRLALVLRLDALALAEAGTALRADPAAGISVPVRADLVPDPAWFSGFEGRADVAVQRLALGPLQASGLALTVKVEAGRLDAALDAATLYGGAARGRYVLDPQGVHQVGLSLAGVRALPLLRDIAGVGGLDGSGGLRLDVQARGATPDALVRSAVGQAEVSVTDGRIDGLDLARAAGLTSLGGGLATRLDRLGGRFDVREGRAATRDLALETGLVAAEGTGELDLVARTIDLRLKPLKVTAGGRLDVPIRIFGPWASPTVTADLAGLARDPAGTIQGLQSLGDSLFGGGSGEAGGDALKGLGGLLDGLLPRRDAPRRRP